VIPKWFKNINNFKLKMENSAIKIQRAFRKWFYRNAICCISLEKVNYPCFIYKTSGVCIFYDYLALNKYFKTSNKFIDPKTRNNYTKLEIERFKKELKLHFPEEDINYSTPGNQKSYFNHPIRELILLSNLPINNNLSIPHQPSGTINLGDLRYIINDIEEYEPVGGGPNISRIY
jgi:hypothetical protein